MELDPSSNDQLAGEVTDDTTFNGRLPAFLEIFSASHPASGYAGSYTFAVSGLSGDKTNSIKGIILPGNNTGYGFFLGTNQSGSALIDRP